MPVPTILAYLAVALLIAIALFLIYVATLPNEYVVARSARVNGSPADAFKQVVNFKNWEHWSPWAKLDPNMKTSFDGPVEGVGAKYSWVGNNKVGEGKMEIVGSKPAEQIDIRLEFIKPWSGVCKTGFAFKPEGKQTNVTWTMTGTNNFTGKIFSCLMNIDKMIGADFEKGLASLNQVVEKA